MITTGESQNIHAKIQMCHLHCNISTSIFSIAAVILVFRSFNTNECCKQDLWQIPKERYCRVWSGDLGSQRMAPPQPIHLLGNVLLWDSGTIKTQCGSENSCQNLVFRKLNECKMGQPQHFYTAWLTFYIEHKF